MTEITTLNQFREIKNGNVDHIVIILDGPNGDKSHFVGCEFVTEENFQEKIIDNSKKNGRYFHYTNRKEAKKADHQGVSPCGRCNANLLFVKT